MGWPAEHTALRQGDHSRQKDVRVETNKLTKEYDVQVFYSWNQDPTQWSHSIDGFDLFFPEKIHKLTKASELALFRLSANIDFDVLDLLWSAYSIEQPEWFDSKKIYLFILLGLLINRVRRTHSDI